MLKVTSEPEAVPRVEPKPEASPEPLPDPPHGLMLGQSVEEPYSCPCFGLPMTETVRWERGNRPRLQRPQLTPVCPALSPWHLCDFPGRGERTRVAGRQTLWPIHIRSRVPHDLGL